MRVLHKAAGAAEHPVPDADLLDVSFDELGYDSLALMETVGEIQREYGVRLADDLVAATTGPRDFLALVNAALAENA
nr:acyl carrier protein [Amycolatopsis sp.]